MSKHPNPILVFGAALASGAIGGAVAWYVIDRIWVVNGQGMLARAGWPADTPVTFAIVGALLSFASACVKQIQRRQRTVEAATLAADLGLAAVENSEAFKRPKMPLFDHWDKAESFFEGQCDGVPLELFDLSTANRGGEETTYDQWTVVLFRGINLPSFDCLEKTWATLLLRTFCPTVHFAADEADLATRQAVNEFNEQYQLLLLQPTADAPPISDETTVRSFFRAPLLAEFARRPGYRVQAADGCLIVARHGFIPLADRDELVRHAVELRGELLRPSHPAAAVIPAGRDQETGRQRARLAGRAIGGLCGGITGFFGGFIIFVSFMFGRALPGQIGLATPFWFFGMVFGGLLGGIIVGAWVGGRVANRRYVVEQPAKPTGINHADGAGIVPGAFLGWIVGGVVGVGLTALLAPWLKMDWLVPFLMFTPPLACLFLGAIVGRRFVLRRRARRQNRVAQ